MWLNLLLRLPLIPLPIGNLLLPLWLFSGRFSLTEHSLQPVTPTHEISLGLNPQILSECVYRYTVYSVQSERPGAGRPIISVSVAIPLEASMPMLSVLIASAPDHAPTLSVSSPRICPVPVQPTSHDTSPLAVYHRRQSSK